jgi:hypothetical protein
LVGEHDRTGYFYEMVAPPSLWTSIWDAVIERFDRLYVNGSLGDPFTNWLVGNRQVVWRHQNKAMWLPVSERVNNNHISAWHIPYFDWI